jgi:hypothetical protein
MLLYLYRVLNERVLRGLREEGWFHADEDREGFSCLVKREETIPFSGRSA